MMARVVGPLDRPVIQATSGLVLSDAVCNCGGPRTCAHDPVRTADPTDETRSAQRTLRMSEVRKSEYSLQRDSDNIVRWSTFPDR